MKAYKWDAETGGLLLTTDNLSMSKEPRPVYSQELDILGFDKYWTYPKDNSVPLMWAEANNYIYKGRLVAQTKGGGFFTAPEIIILEEPEPEGGEMRHVDIDAMVAKNKVIMEQLTNETIKKATNVYERFKSKVDIFHVSYSGGKDSEVTLDIIQRALPHNGFVVIFGDTGMEFPDTYISVEATKKKCDKENIKFLIAKSHIAAVESWRKIGPPSATNRWCCSIHKTTPQLLTLREVVGKTMVTEMAFVGVRGDESLRRSGYDYISYGMKHRGQYSCYPILNWNSAEVYLYIYSNGLNLNEAYKKGNSRAGCLVCPVSTNRNDYFNNYNYPESTQSLLQVIRELDKTDQGNEDKIRSYIENKGWKARKSGRDLSIALKDYDESIIDNKLVISFKNHNDEWLQWLKTIGNLNVYDNEVHIHADAEYLLTYKSLSNGYMQIIVDNDKTTKSLLFQKKVRIICRKCHYCVACKVCEANCKYGNLKFDDTNYLRISDSCIKCGQCLDIDTGCLVYKSLWISKGLGNMKKSKSIDCYDAHGPKMEWFVQWSKLGEMFKSEHTLGSKQYPAFNRFLRDAGAISGDSVTLLGKLFKQNMGEDFVWALMLTNLSYSPEVGWFVDNFGINEEFKQKDLVNKLGTAEGVSASALKSIPAALKRITLLPFSKVGFGISEKTSKEDGGTKFIRTPWQSPNPDVILYSLYKFAEACGDYKQFTLSRLMDTSIDSDGVTPVQLFGLDRETLKRILNGLSISRPDFINASFTLDLDNITLRDDKTSEDVLNLF